MNISISTAIEAMGESEFVANFGGIYEHSTWVASKTWQQPIRPQLTTVQELATALAATVDQADDEQKLQLINAHPDLAGRAAVAGTLTDESTAEQASAGIDQCTEQEFERFQSLNTAYKKRFGFTFVMAVKGSNRRKILDGFNLRLQNDRATEFATAIKEIHKIARMRLEEFFQSGKPDSEPEDASVLPPDKNPFTHYTDLAQPRLGSVVVYATDDFFADKSRLIEPGEPVFIPDEYDENGKWMDGWESRRKRGPGHDFCIVQLGVPGVIHGVDIDTSHFTGNFPPMASLDGCICDEAVPHASVGWKPIIEKTTLQGNAHHYLSVTNTLKFTHVRLNIFPDGGVARLRVYGKIKPDWNQVESDELMDLLALENGGMALVCNDQHFGSMHNLNAPGRGVNMGDGWETARRRTPGNDWVILALGHAGIIEKIDIDTAHFKGNYPDRVCIQAALTDVTDIERLSDLSTAWETLLPEVKLSMDKQHEFVEQVRAIGPVSHVRVSIFPDGGLSRIRLFGYVSVQTVVH